jgi:hypothetical protein
MEMEEENNHEGHGGPPTAGQSTVAASGATVGSQINQSSSVGTSDIATCMLFQGTPDALQHKDQAGKPLVFDPFNYYSVSTYAVI